MLPDCAKVTVDEDGDLCSCVTWNGGICDILFNSSSSISTLLKPGRTYPYDVWVIWANWPIWEVLLYNFRNLFLVVQPPHSFKRSSYLPFFVLLPLVPWSLSLSLSMPPKWSLWPKSPVAPPQWPHAKSPLAQLKSPPWSPSGTIHYPCWMVRINRSWCSVPTGFDDTSMKTFWRINLFSKSCVHERVYFVGKLLSKALCELVSLLLHFLHILRDEK